MIKYKVAFLSKGNDVFCNTIDGPNFASTDLNKAYRWKEQVYRTDPMIYVKAVEE